MSVHPPTPALMALNQALASKPINRLTPEAVRAQVAEGQIIYQVKSFTR